MQWTKETEEIVATLPLPPVLSSYDRLKCDRLARKQRCFPIHKRTWYRALAITLAIGLILGLGCNDNPDEPPTVIISDQGGTYVTPEGIILEVPAGAVSEPTRVYVVMMDKSSTQTPLNENGLLRREFIAGVTLTTEVNPLQKSIWVTLPIDYSPVFTSIPLHYVYDEGMDSYYPAYTDLTLSPADGTVAFSVNEFGTHVVALVEQIDVPSARLAQTALECEESNPCRCETITAREDARDNYYSTTDCQISSIEGSVFYHDCGENGVTESWEFTEHTKGCVPQMKLVPERTVIWVEETTSIHTLITYGDKPISGIDVTMTPSGFVILSPTTAVTGIEGTAETIVEAGMDDGLARISAQAVVDYTPAIIKVNGQIQYLESRHKMLHAKTAIAVEKQPVLTIDIVPNSKGNYLLVNQQTKVKVSIEDPDPDAPDGFHYLFASVDLSATRGRLETTSVTTSSSGPVEVTYTAPDNEGPVTISGSATVETLASNAESLTYDIKGQDTIEVKSNVERWVGSIELNYSGCTPRPRIDVVCTGVEYSGAVNVDFTLNYVPTISSPGPETTNVSGSGTATLFLDSTDGPVVFLEPTGPCTLNTVQDYVHATRTYPFAVSIEGIMQESSLGKDLLVLFNHPSGGSQGIIAEMDIGVRKFCNGELLLDEVRDNYLQIHWNPAIVFEWDPAYSDDYGYRLDLTGKTSVTQNGSCGSMYTGSDQECTYTLTMTLESTTQ